MSFQESHTLQSQTKSHSAWWCFWFGLNMCRAAAAVSSMLLPNVVVYTSRVFSRVVGVTRSELKLRRDQKITSITSQRDSVDCDVLCFRFHVPAVVMTSPWRITRDSFRVIHTEKMTTYKNLNLWGRRLGFSVSTFLFYNSNLFLFRIQSHIPLYSITPHSENHCSHHRHYVVVRIEVGEPYWRRRTTQGYDIHCGAAFCHVQYIYCLQLKKKKGWMKEKRRSYDVSFLCVSYIIYWTLLCFLKLRIRIINSS